MRKVMHRAKIRLMLSSFNPSCKVRYFNVPYRIQFNFNETIFN